MTTPLARHAPKAGFALVFAATALVGWKLGATGDPEAKYDDHRGGAAAADGVRIPTRSSAVRGAERRRIEALAAAVSNAGDTRDRMRATISLVKALPLEDLGPWLAERHFENRGGFDLTLFNMLAKERWRQEDPEGFLAWAIREGEQSSEVVFNRWAEEDPQRLIDFFRETPDASGELRALGRIAANDPALALRRYREMVDRAETGVGNDYQAMTFLRELAGSSPETLEAELASMPDDMRSQAEAALVGERLKTDFDSEIRKLWERPDGLRLFELSMTGRSVEEIGSGLLNDFDNMPASWKAHVADNSYRYIQPENAADWLAVDFDGQGLDEGQADRLRYYAIQQLATSDVAGAIRAIGDVGDESGMRKNLIRNLFSRYANDGEKVAAMMGMLTSDEDRAIASAQMEERPDQSGPGGGVRQAFSTPDEWIEAVGSLGDGTSESYRMGAALRGWNKEQIGELSAKFQSLPSGEKEAAAKILAGVNTGYETDPGLRGDAIRYLVENPPENEDQQGSRNPSALTSRHAVRWGMTDPVAAGSWTTTLPEGEARLWAQKNLAANWARLDPEAAERWVGTLPSADRKEVRSFIENGGE